MKIIMHNAPFDTARLKDNFGIGVWDYPDLCDTILMHSLLWSEFKHGLEFLASVYSTKGKAKHLGVGSYDYLVGDIVSTMESYEAMLLEFEQDPQSAALYYGELKPLLPILIEFMGQGVPVNSNFVVECLEWIPQQMVCAQQIADAYAGYPVSIESGPQMRVLLDGIEDVFAEAKRLTGIAVKKELTPKGELSLDKDTVSALRSAFLPVAHNEELDPILAMQRIAEGAHPLLEAKALWGSARVRMSNYVKPLLIPLEEGADGYTYTGELHTGDGAPQILFREIDEQIRKETVTSVA